MRGNCRLPFLEEYPTPHPLYVLNGFMFTLLGLYDLASVAPRSEAHSLYLAGRRTLTAALPSYDRAGVALYDLASTHIAPQSYQAVQLYLLRALSSLSQTLNTGGTPTDGRRTSRRLPKGREHPEAPEAAARGTHRPDVWSGILTALGQEFTADRRRHSVISAPSILAGIGALAHRAMTTPPRSAEIPRWNKDQVMSHLAGVTWEREVRRNGYQPESPWDGVAGKFSPKGRFSVSGPKEVGHAVFDALVDPESPGGRRIRTPLP